ncbi:ATP-dependent DEAD/H RNA helicase [Trypanosoma cruzi Dm28c]|uniref:ATP-dependent DEAD/H RNA helicase n=1 Tax=Trypanosoma cruzi Dm28c TaxID=1416333 RepID=V5D6L9_TRYCR|nr:ATP-dependent DEAD/H RNA helicase [Trypanosoma cruzi Dm28c]
MAITVLRLQQFRIQAPQATASLRPTETIHIFVRARPVRCPRRDFVKFQRNNRADVLIHQTPLVLNDACGARTNVTAVGGAAKCLCVFSIAEHVRILGGKIIGCIALVDQEVAATAAAQLIGSAVLQFTR